MRVFRRLVLSWQAWDLVLVDGGKGRSLRQRWQLGL